MWIVLEDSDCMRFEKFGGISIFRPRYSIEVKLRNEAENRLRSKYPIGKYTDKNIINEILHFQFAFFTDLLEDLLPKLASVDFLKFLLYEYEKAAQIDVLYKKDKLSVVEKDKWANLGSNLRRAIKYLAERITLFAPDQAPISPESELLAALEKVWICAEELVKYYMLSDQTFSIFPDATVLEILPEGQPNYWILEIIDNPCAFDLQERVRIDTANRDRFIPTPQFQINASEHEKILDTPLQETIGASYHTMLDILGTLIDGSQPPEDDFPIPFLNRNVVIKSLAEDFALSLEVIEKILSGFTVSKTKMEAEGRKVWKPKQEYRAHRRGVFEVPHPTGTHLIFSKEMARESWLLLLSGVAFKQLPPEWQSDTVNYAIETLSNEASKWFEQVVLKNFEKVNIFGAKSLNRGIGQGCKRLEIPSSVGEIDYLGYSSSEELLVVAECKMVSGKTEPRLFRDDISQFVTSKDSYFNKFEKKVSWVRANMEEVCTALSSIQTYEAFVKPKKVATVMVTYFPTIASCFSNQFPCITIAECMMGYVINNKWPYEVGLFDC